MEAYKNIYGVQKRPEQDVRSGLDIALGASNTAATGAQIGNKVMPGGVGAAVGGAAGLLFGLEQQRQGKIKEEIQKDSDVAYNKFADSLSGRVAQTQYMSPVQAKKGIKSNKYQIGEIEGDGSGDPNGLGEIHTDKNYNVKNIPNGGKSHEEGGVKVQMEEGDIVFPTQGNKQMYDKVMGLISRYKRGDSNAKNQLEKIRQSLPSDADSQKYNDGTKKVKPQELGDEFPSDFEDMTKRAMDELEMLKKYYEENPNDKPANFDQIYSEEKKRYDEKYGETSSFFEADLEDGDSSVKNEKMTPGNQMKMSTQNLMNKYDLDLDEEAIDSLNNESNNNTTLPENRIEEFIAENIDLKDEKALRDKAKEEGINPDELLDFLDTALDPRGIKPKVGEGSTGTRNWGDEDYRNIGPKAFKSYQSLFNDVETSPMERALEEEQEDEEDFDLSLDELDEDEIYYEDDDEEEEIPDAPFTDQFDEQGNPIEEEEEESNYSPSDYDYMKIEDRSSPLRYANVLNNLLVGSKPADRVTRRYYQPEELKYKDRSASDRRASTEKRNYQSSLMRGKGLSAGQQQSYSSQIGSRFLAENEAINEREARIADQIDQYNVQGRNQAKMQNIGLANQYDAFDDQADASKQAYTDAAMSETSDLAESKTRDAYKRDADRRAFFIQNKSIPLASTGNYVYKNGKWWEPTFTGGGKYTKKVNNSSTKQPKVNKFGIKQGQRQ